MEILDFSTIHMNSKKTLILPCFNFRRTDPGPEFLYTSHKEDAFQVSLYNVKIDKTIQLASFFLGTEGKGGENFYSINQQGSQNCVPLTVIL